MFYQAAARLVKCFTGNLHNAEAEGTTGKVLKFKKEPYLPGYYNMPLLLGLFPKVINPPKLSMATKGSLMSMKASVFHTLDFESMFITTYMGIITQKIVETSEKYRGVLEEHLAIKRRAVPTWNSIVSEQLLRAKIVEAGELKANLIEQTKTFSTMSVVILKKTVTATMEKSNKWDVAFQIYSTCEIIVKNQVSLNLTLETEVEA